MAISLTQLGNVQHSIVNKYWKFHVIASSNIGSLLHHHFIYAKLEELYLVNSKKRFDCTVQFKNTERYKSTKLEK